MLKGVNKIVGYFGYTSSGTVICQEDACIISGSQGMMHAYIKETEDNKDRSERTTIKATTFGEIMSGIYQGAPHAFDEGAYSIFLQLAQRNGTTELPSNACFSQPSPTGRRFIVIQYKNCEKLFNTRMMT